MCTWQCGPGSVDLYKNRLTLLVLLNSVDADVIEQTRTKVNQGHRGLSVWQRQLCAAAFQ